MTTTTNNTLSIETNLILDSFISGSGKTNDIGSGFKVSDKIKIDGLSLWLNGFNITFVNEAHKNAFITNMVYKGLKDLPLSQLEKTCSHISSGLFLSLNHKEAEQTLPDYTATFQAVNYTEFKRVTAKSKLYTLLFDVTPENISVLTTAGFVIHSPIVDNITYKVSGFTIELPKKD